MRLWNKPNKQDTCVTVSIIIESIWHNYEKATVREHDVNTLYLGATVYHRYIDWYTIPIVFLVDEIWAPHTEVYLQNILFFQTMWIPWSTPWSVTTSKVHAQ